jgi:7-alpha-hydroxysteroid dehydrogenase
VRSSPGPRTTLDAVADEIRAVGRNVAIPADVTDIETLGDVVEQAADSLGGLDILVNNAGGVEQLGTYMDMTVAILENAFRFKRWIGAREGRA